MGGVTTEFGGEVTVVYHAEEDRTHLETVLTAVVVWRRGDATYRGWRPRFSRWQFRMGLHPLNRRFSLGREAGLWYGSAGMNGEHATMFHPIRRVVRVLGREYLLAPRGITLVLLIDEQGVAPQIREVQMPAPRLGRTAEQLDPESGRLRYEGLKEETDAWRAALLAHADTAAFIAPV